MTSVIKIHRQVWVKILEFICLFSCLHHVEFGSSTGFKVLNLRILLLLRLLLLNLLLLNLSWSSTTWCFDCHCRPLSYCHSCISQMPLQLWPLFHKVTQIKIINFLLVPSHLLLHLLCLNCIQTRSSSPSHWEQLSPSVHIFIYFLSRGRTCLCARTLRLLLLDQAHVALIFRLTWALSPFCRSKTLHLGAMSWS